MKKLCFSTEIIELLVKRNRQPFNVLYYEDFNVVLVLNILILHFNMESDFQ